MIKVHLQKILPGEILSLTGEADAACLELEEAGFKPVGPFRYELEVGLSGGGLFATGSLFQQVRTTCVACSEEFEYEVTTKEFAMQEEVAFNCEFVDLTSEVREDIHLLLPMHPRCNLGGNKCPAQFPQRVVPSPEISEARPVWAALDNITYL